MSEFSPTRNPSTAGARWLFAQKEYLRSVGPLVRSDELKKFRELRKKIEASDIATLKRRLAALQGRKLKGNFSHRITAEILAIEGELGARKSWKENGNAAKSIHHERTLIVKAFPYFMQELGAQKTKEILLRIANEVAANHYGHGVDPMAIIEEALAYAAQKVGLGEEEE